MACQTCVCMQTHRSHKNTFIRAGRESNPKGGRRGGNKQEDFFEETLVRISLICTSQTEPYFYANGEKSPRRRLCIALSVLLKQPSTTPELQCWHAEDFADWLFERGHLLLISTLGDISLSFFQEVLPFWGSSAEASAARATQLSCSSPRLVEWMLEDLPMQPAHLASVQRFPAP